MAGGGKLRIYKNDTLQIELTAPWSDADLPKVRITQSYDTALFFHPGYEPQKLLRQGSDTSWTLEPMTLEYRPFYRFTDVGAIKLTPSSTSGSITLTANSALFNDSSWVDIRVRINNGIAKITSVTNTTTVNATVETNLVNTTQSETWEEQAWSAKRGWPVCGHFHASRLFVGGSRDLPQIIWASKTSLIYDFNDGATATTVKDDDGFDFTLSASEVSAIYDLYSIRNVLQIFTSSSEWICDAKPVTPSSVSFVRATPHGTSDSGIRIVSIDSDALFVDRTKKMIRGFSYDFNTDAFVAKNLTLLSPDICSNPTHSAYLKGFGNSQGNFAIFRNTDGNLILMTIDTAQKVLGWGRWTSEASFLAVCVVGDTFYALQSYNNKRYITKLSIAEVYLDLYGRTTMGSPTTTFTGFTTFANKTVSVVADGFVFENIAVNGSGGFTLPVAATDVYVGLPYTALYESLPLAPAVNGQLMRGNRLRKVLADITVRNTKDVWVDGKQIPLIKIGVDALDQPATAKNTTFRHYLSPRWGAELTLVVESRKPLPLMLIGAVAEVDVAT